MMQLSTGITVDDVHSHTLICTISIAFCVQYILKKRTC